MKTTNLLLPFFLLISSVFNYNLHAQDMRVGPILQETAYPVRYFQEPHFQFLNEAKAHFKLLNQQETLFALDNAVLHNPNSAPALLKRAQFKELIGLKTEAAQDFRLANQLNPYASNLYGYNGPTGVMNLIAFQPQLAMRELSIPRRMDYYYSILYDRICEGSIDDKALDILEEAIIEIEEGEYEDAYVLLDAMLGLYPNSAIGYDLMGVTLGKLNRLEEASAAFSNAVALQPDFAIAWYNFSQVERKLGNLEKAKTYLDNAISLQGDLTKAYFDRAIIRKSLQDEEGAITDYNNIIKMKGDNYMEAYLNRGLTRKLLGDFEGALSDLNKALQELPEDARLYNNRGNLYLIFNNHEQAIKDYSKAIELDETMAEAYYNRGLAYLAIHSNETGCIDLNRSAEFGYEKAEEKQKFFCGN